MSRTINRVTPAAIRVVSCSYCQIELVSGQISSTSAERYTLMHAVKCPRRTKEQKAAAQLRLDEWFERYG